MGDTEENQCRKTRSRSTKKRKTTKRRKKPYTKAQAKRFFARLKKLRADYYFDRKEARRAEMFFANELVHTEGEWAGQPFVLERWQRRIVRRLFGWKRKSNGTRKYRVCLIFVPRGQGKSFLGAGIALYLLMADREIGARVVSAAANREQAEVIFGYANKIVAQNEKFKKLGAAPLRRAIPVYRTGSTYKVISADASTKHGQGLHGVLLDELHAQPNRHLFDTLKTGTRSRRQPLEVYTTTAGYDRTSICYEVYDYAKKVKDGIIEDESFLPVLYEADPEDDFTDPEVWKKANPNYEVSVSHEYLARMAQQAIETPSFENTFKRLHLNIWTEQDVRLIPMHQWDACGEQPITPEMMFKKRCYLGLDLSTTLDTTCASLVFPMEDGEVWVLPYIYVPREAAHVRSRKQRVPYEEWISEGLMIATEGNVVDYDFIRAHINELGEKFDIRAIVADRWNATQIITQLDGDGFEVVPFGQGYASMSAPTKELLKLVASGKIKHGGHKVLRWMASNVGGETDAAGNVKPSKKKSAEKIDGIVATIMGIGWMMRADNDPGSVYDERGLVVI